MSGTNRYILSEVEMDGESNSELVRDLENANEEAANEIIYGKKESEE